MSNAIVKNAVIVLGVEQGDVNFKVDLGPILKALEKEKALLDQIKESGDKVAAAQKKQAEAEKKVKQDALRDLEKVEQAQRRLADVTRATNLKMLEGSQQLGEGLFTTARGFTLLGISGDENLAKVAKKLAIVQAGFDIFRGVSTTIKTVIEVQEALNAVTEASSAVTALNTTSTLANAAAKTTSAKASLFLLAASNPVTLAVGIATAAIVLLTLAREDDTKSIESHIEGLDKERAAFDKKNAAESARAQLGGASSNEANLEAAKKTVKEIERQRDATLALRSVQHELIDNNALGDNARLAAAEKAEMLTERAIDQNRDRSIALLAVQNAEKAIADEKERAIQVSKQQAQADQQAAQQKLQQFQQEFEAVKGIREQEQQRLQAEKDRIAGNQQSVGRLDEIGRARLDNVTKRAQGGKELSQSDLGFLGGLGGGFADFANKQFEKRGGDAGELLGRLGVSASGGTGEDALSQIIKSGEDLSEGVQDVFEKVNTVLNGTLTQLQEFALRLESSETGAAKGRG